jgi:hypothetical protein
MTANKIENLEQLRAEIQRLKKEEAEHKAALRAGVTKISEQLRPENILVSVLSSITGININKNEFLKNGIAMGLSLLLQRFVFKTEASLERKLYTWLDRVFDQVKYYTNKFSSSGSVRAEKVDNDYS